MRPVLVLRMKPNDALLYLANVGSGPALDVTFAEGQSGQPLNPIGAAGDWPLRNFNQIQWQFAKISYERFDGISYVTHANSLIPGKYKQLVQKLPKVQGREAGVS